MSASSSHAALTIFSMGALPPTSAALAAASSPLKGEHQGIRGGWIAPAFVKPLLTPPYQGEDVYSPQKVLSDPFNVRQDVRVALANDNLAHFLQRSGSSLVVNRLVRMGLSVDLNGEPELRAIEIDDV